HRRRVIHRKIRLAIVWPDFPWKGSVLLTRKFLPVCQRFPPASQFRTGSGSDRVTVLITRSLPLPVLNSDVNCNSTLVAAMLHTKRRRYFGKIPCVLCVFVVYSIPIQNR